MRPALKFSLKAIAAQVNGTLHGPPDLVVHGLCGLDQPQPGAMTFAESLRAVQQAESSQVTAVLTPPDTATALPAIWVDKPRVAFARILAMFHPEPQLQPGVSPLASVSPTALISPQARLGPFTRVGPGAVVSDGVDLRARVTLGPGVFVGAWSRLLPGVSVGTGSSIGARCVIDAGAALGAATRLKDDIYIGARSILDGCSVDVGSKLDNLVLVERGAVVGAHCILVSQASLGERVRLGKLVTVAGQARVEPDITVADGVQIAGRSWVTKSLTEPGSLYAGHPARPLKEELLNRRLIARAGQIYQRVMALR